MNETEEIDLASGLAAFESKHFSSAMQYLSPLARAGNAEAQYRVAIMFQNGLGLVANETQAFAWLQQAAEQNHGLAQHGLGCCYLAGQGTVNDDEAAVTGFGAQPNTNWPALNSPSRSSTSKAAVCPLTLPKPTGCIARPAFSLCQHHSLAQ